MDYQIQAFIVMLMNSIKDWWPGQCDLIINELGFVEGAFSGHDKDAIRKRYQGASISVQSDGLINATISLNEVMAVWKNISQE